MSVTSLCSLCGWHVDIHNGSISRGRMWTEKGVKNLIF